MEQEKKLAAYRAKKKREEKMKQFKDSIMNMFKWNKSTPIQSTPEHEIMLNNTEENLNEEIEQINIPTRNSDTVPTNTQTKRMKIEFYIASVLLWVFTYILFIKIQFGTIYLIVSAIFGIYLNTRTGPKNENEISAYSVFNKNCESIDGTLKAEQFEREIRFGAVNVH